MEQRGVACVPVEVAPMDMDMKPTDRMLRFFEFSHLPENLQRVSKPCAELAADLTDRLPQSPELTAGLRKLLEAKDCFVRAALEASDR